MGGRAALSHLSPDRFNLRRNAACSARLRPPRTGTPAAIVDNSQFQNAPGAAPAMTDLPPDRLSVDPASPFYNEAALARGVGVRFRGVERRDVEEYCVGEAWIRAAAGKALDRRGQPLVIKMTGTVEPYYLNRGQVLLLAETDSPWFLAYSKNTFVTNTMSATCIGKKVHDDHKNKSSVLIVIDIRSNTMTRYRQAA